MIHELGSAHLAVKGSSKGLQKGKIFQRQDEEVINRENYYFRVGLLPSVIREFYYLIYLIFLWGMERAHVT